jgi:ribonuclease D
MDVAQFIQRRTTPWLRYRSRLHGHDCFDHGRAGSASAPGGQAGSDYVTVDTEFLRETTYWPKLCLDPGGDGRSEAVLIDPLASGLDLTPFLRPARRQREGVARCSTPRRQDIEIFVKLTGQVPSNIFDTQVAASRLRLRRQRLVRQPGALDRQCLARQVLSLHRLVGAPPEREAAGLRPRGRHAPARRSIKANWCKPDRRYRPLGLGRRRTEPCSRRLDTYVVEPLSMPGSGSRLKINKPTRRRRAEGPRRMARAARPGRSDQPRSRILKDDVR